ncbi:hypothetical protein [Enterococcus gallinarum]|uniref:hypothetical protein n=1 Tax=Enterococcus gallinarum TaxID=1353 RepID=UPI003D6A829C
MTFAVLGFTGFVFLVAICVVVGKATDKKRSKIMEEAILWNKMALIVETILMEQIKEIETKAK